MGIKDLDVVTSIEIKKSVLEILDALCDRKGFDDWWYNLDDDIEAEIEAELFNLMNRRFNKHKFEQKKP